MLKRFQNTVTDPAALQAMAVKFYPQSPVMQKQFVEKRSLLERTGQFVLFSTSTASLRSLRRLG